MQPVKSHQTFGGQTQFYEHESRATRSSMRFSCFRPALPPKGCVIWLSGLTCTEENFITKAGAQRYLADAQLMVVCPDTSPRGIKVPSSPTETDVGMGAGFYVDATTEAYREHFQMYSYVADELYAWVSEELGPQQPISLMGHSMGGHGALVLGLREPEKFCSISAFSPIVHPSAAPWGKKAFAAYLGPDSSAWKAYDACALLEAGLRHPAPILVDQGRADPFLKEQLLTADFEKACVERGQKLDLRYRDGYDHSYYYISSFIGEHIAFHAAAMAARLPSLTKKGHA